MRGAALLRIAILEAVSAGLCGGQGEDAWLQEGLAMWRALVSDVCADQNLHIETLLDSRWSHHRPQAANLHVWSVSQPAEAIMCWDAALSESDAALIVAPESDDVLARLLESLPASVISWNCRVAAVRLCADKLALSEFLRDREIPTLPTVLEEWRRAPEDGGYPLVIKPRDGAGSLLVRRVANSTDWKRLHAEYLAAGVAYAVRQSFVAGRPLSIAGWFDGRGGVDWLPIAAQRLSDDGKFVYQGGSLPAVLESAEVAAVQQLVRAVACAISELRGYVGIDLLLPAATPLQPLVVEINPRLTTSYVGYREWWTASPWTAWLRGTSAAEICASGRGHVWFAADGTISREEPR